MLGIWLAAAWAAPGGGQVEIPTVDSVHLEHARIELGASMQEAPPPPMELMPPGDRPDVWVYGYLPYWADTLSTVPWDSLTHVAVFDVGVDSNGNLTDTNRWTSIASKVLNKADQYGVKVHLTLTCFSSSVMKSILNSETKRAKVVNAVSDLVNDYGAHGVSVDFEGVPSSVKAGLVSLVEEFSEQVDEVTVATPAIDWEGSFDYDELAAASDALFIMGYGYHWSGGNPGPISPLYGGGVWGKYSLEWSVEDHLEWGATRDRIVLGLPLYGRNWPSTSTSVPGTATADGEAVVFANAIPWAESLGRKYDSTTETPYAFPSNTEQLWYDDHESLRAKIAYAVDEGLLGIGFWALNYDGADVDFWAMVREETRFESTPDDTGEAPSGTLEISGPQMAYVDEVFTLSLEGDVSEVETLVWTQTLGGQSLLEGLSSDELQVTAQEAGRMEFVLSVTMADGAETLLTHGLEVVRTQSTAGCACASGSRHWSNWLWAAGLVLICSRRRLSTGLRASFEGDVF